MNKRCFRRVATAVAVAVLSEPMLFAQDTSSTPAQKPPAPVQNGASSPLPDDPAPNRVPLSGRSAGVATSQSSSSSEFSSSSPQPKFWTSSDPNAQVTVLENTLIRVMNNAPLSTRETRERAPLSFLLSEDVVVDGVLIVPRGATVHGTVADTRQAGALTGSAKLVLKLTSLEMGGRSYPLYTYPLTVEGASKTKPTENKVKGGAVIGAIAGAAFSGSANGAATATGKLAGAGTGAALGAGVGTAISAATPGPVVTIPAESQMDFYLASPISVVPVTQKEAERLSKGLYPGGPVLYVRGETP